MAVPIPSLNLSSDSLGLGTLFSSVFGGQQGTAECGARPNCIIGSSCKDRKEAYEECVARTQANNAINAKNAVATTAITEEQKTKRMIYIAIAIAIVFVVIAFFKFKK